MPEGGTLDVNLGDFEVDEQYSETHDYIVPGSYVMFSISDTGIGLSKEIQHCIFDPFFTTRKVGSGTVMGLSVVHGIVKESGGTISVYS